jgi:hypothetical protein
MHNQVWGLRRALKGLPPVIEKPLASAGKRLFERLPKKKRWTPLTPELRAELSRLFEEDIAQLEALLERDLNVWREPVPARA